MKLEKDHWEYRWTCFDVRVARRLGYPSNRKLESTLVSAQCDPNARPPQTDEHGNSAKIRSNERIAR